MTDTEKDALERRIDELCQENEQMRKTATMLANARTTLLAENAKLRELARGLGQCAQGVSCEDCLLYDLSEPDHCREERLSRSLGIEVPS